MSPAAGQSPKQGMNLDSDTFGEDEGFLSDEDEDFWNDDVGRSPKSDAAELGGLEGEEEEEEIDDIDLSLLEEGEARAGAPGAGTARTTVDKQQLGGGNYLGKTKPDARNYLSETSEEERRRGISSEEERRLMGARRRALSSEEERGLVGLTMSSEEERGFAGLMQLTEGNGGAEAEGIIIFSSPAEDQAGRGDHVELGGGMTILFYF